MKINIKAYLNVDRFEEYLKDSGLNYFEGIVLKTEVREEELFEDGPNTKLIDLSFGDLFGMIIDLDELKEAIRRMEENLSPPMHETP